MNKITILEDIMNPLAAETFVCEDLRDFLMTRYDKFPEHGRLFHETIAQNSDVTPFDEKGIERLGRLQGNFFLVVYPELPLWAILLIVSIAVIAVSVIISFVLRPSLSANIKNTQQTSPNNSLSDRQNSARLLERVPDIVGEIQSIPDLLAQPYKVFKNGKEVELAYMCVGRGAYKIESFNDPIVIDLAGVPRNPTPGP
jgi:hypothetical protein